jgi:hypothetical protein
MSSVRGVLFVERTFFGLGEAAWQDPLDSAEASLVEARCTVTLGTRTAEPLSRTRWIYQPRAERVNGMWRR